MPLAMLAGNNRRAIRATPNPMDKCTVVSIYPSEINEVKPTIQPGIFKVPAGSVEKPGLLVVGSSSWWKDLDEEQPLLEIPINSVNIADSIIRDWAKGILGCDMGVAQPGVFWVMGEKNIIDVKVQHAAEIDKAVEMQKRWYKKLVDIADNLWARTNGNPLTISREARLAAQELQMKDKPWLKDFNTLELTNCPACGTLRNSTYPVCANCKTILDKKKFDELGLQVAV